MFEHQWGEPQRTPHYQYVDYMYTCTCTSVTVNVTLKARYMYAVSLW